MNTIKTWTLKLTAGGFLYALCLFYEKRWPLRRPTQPKFRRLVRNITFGLIGSQAARWAFYPLLLQLAATTAHNGWGLLSLFPLSQPLRMALAFLALDYTLYVWHWMNHRIPFLWRFHNTHHIDLDLDITTAARFHFGELLLSAGPRALEILVFGLDPLSLLVYDAVVVVSVHFHHSNMRLPLKFEKALSFFIVTPRMHGIHHSIVERETNSNFSTIFPFWDRLHRTLKLNVPQSQITIGVASYRDPAELTLLNSLLLPFRPQRAWRMPDGSYPERKGEDGFRTGTIVE